MILGALIAGISEYGKPRASGDDPWVIAVAAVSAA